MNPGKRHLRYKSIADAYQRMAGTVQKYLTFKLALLLGSVIWAELHPSVRLCSGKPDMFKEKAKNMLKSSEILASVQISYFAHVQQVDTNCYMYQWRSQNAEKVTHIKERLLDQEVVLFNCVPFQNGNFS